MRTEQDMLDLIMNTARQDERIRVVMMNGSRANPNAPHDRFQDFDVVYFVTDMAHYIKNLEWIQRFGELMILQMPEDVQDPPPDNDGNFGYLMQFTDGNRIDLGIDPLETLAECLNDSLTIILLDKDGIVPHIPPATDRDYLPKTPTAKLFTDCCNEFWWVSAYVAKGLWREEFTYAKAFLDEYVRPQMMKMLTWHIGIKTGFSINSGNLGKYFQKYLEPYLWEMLLKTYADGSYEHTWDALFAMGELFRKAALGVADHFGFEYNQGEDQRMSAHLRHVHKLPRDAKEIY
jgi:aminoglycoside 6-adenylyltransferase